MCLICCQAKKNVRSRKIYCDQSIYNWKGLGNKPRLFSLLPANDNFLTVEKSCGEKLTKFGLY